MRHRSLLIVLLAIMLPVVTLYAQDEGAKKADDKTKEVEADKEKKELKLEDLFPKKSIFGPSARSTAFSFDGKYATYMYRPYIERRHGSDIWLLDTDTNETKRLTSVVVMSEFMESVRKVKEDREKKAKKAGIGKKKKKNSDAEAGEETEEDKNGEVAADDVVSGTWEGKLSGPEDLGFPPDGMPFTLTLILHTDNSVTGTISAMGQESDLSEGKYDTENSQLTARIIINADDGDTADLNVTIIDGTLKGEVTAAALGAVVQIEGKRTSTKEDKIEEEQVQDDDKDGDGDGEKEEEEEEDDEVEEEIILGNWVGKKDGDDEKAPRYSGVSSYVWSPVGNEFIFSAGGDLYRYEIEDDSITRLTKTSEYERSIQYLPDGSGYTYMRGSNVLKVSFGSHLVDQLDPRLPSGESMMGYELSPDGTRMVFMTRKVLQSQASRTVNIMTFRGRFAEVRQVPRHVSDDKLQRAETSIWLYDMNDSWHEEANLKKVYTHNYTGPRDILQVPEWAPNSEKVCFAVYTQKTGNVEIYVASFPEKEEEAEETDTEAETEETDTEEADKEEEKKETKKEKPEIKPAKVVYKFYHNGGPTTPSMIHPYYFADSHRMVFLTEMSGFRQLHTLDPTYEALEQLTYGKYEVYPYGISRDNKVLFATATKEHPSQEDVYSINLEERKMTRLSKDKGVYSSVAISQDGTEALANHVTYGELRELQFLEAEEQIELTESHPDKAREMTEPMPEFFTYKNRHGHTIYGHMFKPDDWTAEDKRPLLIYVYGGPLGTRKTVVDGSYSSASYFFAYYMAKKHGYVTCAIDPRGVSGFGAVFEKANYEQVGKPQVEDIVDAGKWFIENQGVDPDRISMHGWSFGGFQTQMCLYSEPDFFNCGIAGAGPTEWENYNSWYSQGTIGKTGEGTADLKKFSLLPLAKNLKARLLLIHGMEDSNVLYQDTVKVYRELLKAGKEALVELFLDPTGSHGLGGDVKTINRYRKYEDFLIRCMGEGEAAEVVAEPEAEEPAEEEAEQTEGDDKD